MFINGTLPAKRLRVSSFASLPSTPRFQPFSSSPSSSVQRLPKSHMRKPPSIPAPLPALYAQQVLLSDGSTYTSYTTAPSPSILRLTRDVTNNPLWNPLSEGRKGEGEEEGGRLAKFRARFGGGVVGGADGDKKPAGATFGTEDFDWMSEGGAMEKISAKDMAGAVKKGSKKK